MTKTIQKKKKINLKIMLIKISLEDSLMISKKNSDKWRNLWKTDLLITIYFIFITKSNSIISILKNKKLIKFICHSFFLWVLVPNCQFQTMLSLFPYSLKRSSLSTEALSFSPILASYSFLLKSNISFIPLKS